jgi:DNA modification methylase
LKIIKRKLADLKCPEKNFRIHDERQISEFCRSISMFGQIRPIVIDECGAVLAGNGLLAALAQLGRAEADCYVAAGLTGPQKKKLMIADNRIYDLGASDAAVLEDFILELNDDLDIPGFDEGLLKAAVFEGGFDEVLTRYGADIAWQANVAGSARANGSGDAPPGGPGPHVIGDGLGDEGDPGGYAESDGIDDAPDVPEAPMTRPGDIWLLGSHRLICGDAADRGTVARLMGGKKAQCVYTDPPYGVSYIGQSGRFGMIRNDGMSGDDLMSSLLMPAFRNLVEFTDDGAAFYIWHASATRRDFEDAMTAAGLVERQCLIWVKNHFQVGHADYHWGHEPCFYASKAGQPAKFYGGRANQTVWRAALRTSRGVEARVTGGIVITDGAGGRMYITSRPPKDKKARTIRVKEQDTIFLYSEEKASTAWEVSRESGIGHPAQKPVELAVRAIGNSTMPGETVLDLFGGSGGALIAAELAGRIACMAELEPSYCDVIVERYIKATGNKRPRCVRSGRELSYAAIKKERDAADKCNAQAP